MSKAPTWRGPHFLHPCSAPGCESEGAFGEGVSLRRGRISRRGWGDTEPAAARVPEKKSDQGRLL